MLRHALLTLALVSGAALGHAQGVGSQLPKSSLRDFGLTDATSLDDFYGRAVLLEFFAHW